MDCKIITNDYTKESEDFVRKAEKENSWCLCIFFSVDFEGSTAYKVEARQTQGDDDWCSTFKSFYINFPLQFLQQYDILDGHPFTYKPLHPALWKFVGDEILFYAPLTDSRQTLEHIRAFYQTIADYNIVLSKQDIKPRCKGTVWVAGFPVNNRIILIPNYASNAIKPDDYSVDFVGISIDCGFRLTKFATSGKLVVSLDLLWMLADSLVSERSITHFAFIRSKIRYAGRSELKGVFSGKPYPVFWISMFSDNTIEGKWENATFCDCDSILKFCDEIASSTKSDFIKPFIAGNKAENFQYIPIEFEQQRNIIKGYCMNEIQSDAD
ncbi:MAG: hypothetical protein LBP59_10410 [Planctomycetaceae bacterium]|jgi:hypothetical protein|nr:hypothetical protein [Planctomycetaceae bacterium]